jgi:predicted transcriptional regulator YheO
LVALEPVMESLVGPIVENLVAGLLGSAIIFAGGFLVGRYRERRRARGRNLEDYDFYPFEVDRDNFPKFDLAAFRRAVSHFLHHSDATAARQLIFIGEQNEVRHQLDRDALSDYERLYAAYGGERIVEDNNEFLQNYKRIVRLIGRTFRDMGIEVLLHNLANPAKSICAIEGGDVTGRALEMGTTSLVIDLKKRRLLNQDKLNYELNIGARRFKCTTIPIYRREFGLVAALCVNIDINYVRDEVKSSPERINDFLAKYARTEMQLEENILSREEYAQAINGKRHWLDEVRLTGRPA